MDMKLEVVVLPVSDVDRAKAFYTTLGWREDADFPGRDGVHVIQMTPPGSPAPVIFGAKVSGAEPGSVQGLHLIVDDVEQARAELVAKGVAVGSVFHDADGVFHHANGEKEVAGPAPERRRYSSFASFSTR
jgi:catechol 2,3-dioxygenase-like lactoylglutathione lyase family enzyme